MVIITGISVAPLFVQVQRSKAVGQVQFDKPKAPSETKGTPHDPSFFDWDTLDRHRRAVPPRPPKGPHRCGLDIRSDSSNFIECNKLKFW
jgi:hypothetical protein